MQKAHGIKYSVAVEFSSSICVILYQYASVVFKPKHVFNQAF